MHFYWNHVEYLKYADQPECTFCQVRMICNCYAWYWKKFPLWQRILCYRKSIPWDWSKFNLAIKIAMENIKRFIIFPADKLCIGLQHVFFSIITGIIFSFVFNQLNLYTAHLHFPCWWKFYFQQLFCQVLLRVKNAIDLLSNDLLWYMFMLKKD